MTAPALKAPFPYFGGKSKVADVVWQYFGDVDNYAEPFFGSGAVLLGRPASHERNAETVNDIDRYLANFWRAVSAAPDEVARYVDWPVNETDLTARHIWLVTEGRKRLENLEADPDLFDAKVAGWWCWGLCCWIGSGWCSGEGPWLVEDGKLVDGKEGGAKRQLPHLGNAGHGVNRKRPHLGGEFSVNSGALNTSVDALAYMQALSARLKHVRVCCGDWSRIVTRGALSYGETVGIFLDPPYLQTIRDANIYNHESNVSAAVREWAIANGDNPRYRIALCGYEGEHEMPDSWYTHYWKAGKSYGTATSENNENRKLERIFFSPHCKQMTLF